MKKTLTRTVLGCCCIMSLCFPQSCTPIIEEEVTTGSISGIVSDKTTGEPIPTVRLTLEPDGTSTVTGSDGSFSFKKIEKGTYTVKYIKDGYKNGEYEVSVKAGLNTEAQLLMERIPAVVTADRSLLDFGENESTNTLSFNIVNPGYVDLEWEIEERCDWITEVKPAKGTLKYSKTEAIVVVIDRDILPAGPNEAVIVVRSSNGSSDVKVTAIGAERSLPSLNMLEATEIASSSATLNGKIINAGIPAYAERGFIYSLNPMPTFDNMLAKLTSPVTDETEYSCMLKGLTLGEKYYVRAYATNSIGTAYSTNEINFTTTALPPEITVQAVTDIDVSKSSAVFNGTVTNAGDPVYEEKGFVYSDSPAPTIYDTKIPADGKTPGTFSVPVNNLELDKVLYVRAYIKRDVTYYSKETVSFTLSTESSAADMVSVTETSYSARRAKFTGTITKTGNPPYSKRGFVYGFNSNPIVENDRSAIVTGSGAEEFSINVSELATGQKYFVRVFTEQNGKYFYSNDEMSFTLEPEPAAVGATDVSETDMNSAKLTSSIIFAVDPEYNEKGFVYNTDGNPSIEMNTGKVMAYGYGVGEFSSRVSNLSSNTTYYARAYVIQNGNVYYGHEASFKTSRKSPVVSSNAATNVMYTSATLNATVTEIGDPAYNRRGFYYGTNANPVSTNSTTIVEDGDSFGNYQTDISGLDEKTTYYYRAFLQQPGETEPILGQTVSFTTGHAPNVTTGGVLNISCSGTGESNLNWSATFYGGLDDPGDPSYTEFGFVYGTAGLPIVNDGNSTYTTTSKFELSGTARVFSVVVSGLPTGKHYHIRAVAKTPLGYVYGEPVEFTTAVVAPVIRTYSTECKYINDTWAAALVGVIGSMGQPAATGFGFVYGLNPTPTVGDGSSIAVSYTKIEQKDNYYVYGAAVSGLTANRNYYVRTYAKTAIGYTYGETLTFRTY